MDSENLDFLRDICDILKRISSKQILEVFAERFNVFDISELIDDRASAM